jgi:glutamate racemase
MDPGFIGVFDSGVGGLSVLREIRRQLPHEDVAYLADQAHVPYGPRPLEEVRGFARGISRFLLDQGAKIIVVACNTASAAALQELRAEFPQVPFVGMEPAVKPAAQISRTRVVGVLATPATFEGRLFASVVERFGAGVEVLPQTLPGLVERIETGDLDGPETRAILVTGLRPLLEQHVDTLVLACTHYPFVIPLLQEIAGPAVSVIDPSPAIARQTGRVLAERDLETIEERRGRLRLLSSAAPERLEAMASQLIEQFSDAQGVIWDARSLKLVLASDSQAGDPHSQLGNR